jgi:hypothetical protein
MAYEEGQSWTKVGRLCKQAWACFINALFASVQYKLGLGAVTMLSRYSYTHRHIVRQLHLIASLMVQEFH